MKKINYLLVIIVVIIVIISVFTIRLTRITTNYTDYTITFPSPSLLTTSTTQTINLKLLPDKQILNNEYHIFQTFNNCGPAALSMALSYYGVNITQQQLGQQLRPYQNPNGINDDKSVTLEELGEKAKEIGLIPYHRPNGNIEIVKNFINYSIPVITRTMTKPYEDIGHYRIIKGFDDTTNELIQDDSLQGKNLRYSYDAFNELWKKFNNEYLVLVPVDKVEIVKSILGEDYNVTTAWKNAVNKTLVEIRQDPNDIYARFNLSVTLYNTGDYRGTVTEFEKVEHTLPFRTLWYQIEPIRAYFQLGNYQRVFEITEKIFHNQNKAYSELYIIRGEIFKKQGNINSAREEFEKAVFYNNNQKQNQELLKSVQ